MSWMEVLYRTYENVEASCVGDLNDKTPLLPMCHSEQNAQIHVVVNDKGEFEAASVIPKKEASGIIPVTEGSAGRAGSKIAPHPLFDKLQYVASDYVEYGGAQKKYGFEEYFESLQAWCKSAHCHRKVNSVRDYLAKGTLIHDLVNAKVLFIDSEGHLLSKWTDKDIPAPDIFGVIPSKDQREAFVRFSVQGPADPQHKLWIDKTVWKSWSNYYMETNESVEGLCFVTGEVVPLAVNHPKRIRSGGDGAKLLSSNDSSGFTFRGKFIEAAQAYGVGMEVTQKAHNALRWLISRQGMQDNGLAVVAWAVSGKEVPDPWADTAYLAGLTDEVEAKSGDAAAGFAVGNRFRKKISGYKAELGDTDQVVVLALDSATPGRMAIKYYRELSGSEYLDRIEHWHEECAWEQYYGKGKRFVGAPSPKMIAYSAYGNRVDDKLRKATVERLLPCIIDNVPIHRDLVDSCVRRACNRVGQEPWEWERTLGVACALYRYSKKGEFDMALNREITTRDYLYGRLLALADYTEQMALTDGEAKRSTSAARFMQRFADHPHSTWRNLELGLQPYRDRLRANREFLYLKLTKEVQSIHDLFEHEDYCNDTPLSGEFLLGFYCQKSDLWASKNKKNDSESA